MLYEDYLLNADMVKNDMFLSQLSLFDFTDVNWPRCILGCDRDLSQMLNATAKQAIKRY